MPRYRAYSQNQELAAEVLLLDLIRGLAINQLKAVETEVDTCRAELREEAQDDRVRRAREQKLSSPGIASTSYPQAIQREQQVIKKLREKAYEASRQALASQMALEAAESSLEALEAAQRRDAQENRHRGHAGTYPEWEGLVDKLFARGVNRHSLKQLSKTEISFIADLIRWKKDDPRHLDDRSPWPAVFAVYAQRTLEIRDEDASPPSLSMPGAPPVSKEYGKKYWHFDAKRGWSHGLKNSRGDAGHLPNSPDESDDLAFDIDPVEIEFEPFPGSEIDSSQPPCLSTTGPTPDEISDVTASPAFPSRSLPASEAPDELAFDIPDIPKVSELNDTLATYVASAYLDQDSTWKEILWPWDIAVDTYDSAQLIPALERFIANGDARSWHQQFLDAAREGRTRSFVDNWRKERLERMRDDLLERDWFAIHNAKTAGLLRS